MVLAVPLSRFASRFGGGSVFAALRRDKSAHVRRHLPLMKNDDNKPQTQSSSPPTRPPKPPVVAAGIGDSDGGNDSMPDYGCHLELEELLNRYCDSDIDGAHSALIEQEKLLRDHIGFPSYKFKLALTMAMRSDIVLNLGDLQAASSIMAEALSVMADALQRPVTTLSEPMTSDGLLKFIREQDARILHAKWRKKLA
jgi:hypothetical protein